MDLDAYLARLLLPTNFLVLFPRLLKTFRAAKVCFGLTRATALLQRHRFLLAPVANVPSKRSDVSRRWPVLLKATVSEEINSEEIDPTAHGFRLGLARLLP